MVEIADRLDIQQLINRYAYHIDLGEVDAWVDLFEEDAVLDESAMEMPVVAGHAEIRAYANQLVGDNLHVVHFMTNHIVSEVVDGRASGTVFGFVEAMTRSNGHGRYYILYRDSYRKAYGTWRFSKRVISPLFPPMAVTGS